MAKKKKKSREDSKFLKLLADSDIRSMFELQQVCVETAQDFSNDSALVERMFTYVVIVDMVGELRYGPRWSPFTKKSNRDNRIQIATKIH